MAVLTVEQQMLRDAAEEWAMRRSPIRALRSLRDQGSEVGFEPAVWAEIAEMGWIGTIVPEEYGGSNLGCLDLALVIEALGRTLTASPLIACGLGKESLNFFGCCNPFSRAQKAARLSEVEARRSSALGSREAPAVKPAAVVVAGLGGDAGAEPRTGCDVRAAQAQPMV